MKYYTNDIGIVAEMKCLVDGYGEKIFYYQFDEKDFLQRIYYFDNDAEEELFDRKQELEEAKKSYYKNKDNCSAVG